MTNIKTRSEPHRASAWNNFCPPRFDNTNLALFEELIQRFKCIQFAYRRDQ